MADPEITEADRGAALEALFPRWVFGHFPSVVDARMDWVKRGKPTEHAGDAPAVAKAIAVNRASLSSDLQEARAELERLRDPMCNTCGGMPPISGLKCVCGGTGKHWDEERGLRLECHRLDGVVDGLERDLTEAREQLARAKERGAGWELQWREACDQRDEAREQLAQVSAERDRLAKDSLAVTVLVVEQADLRDALVRDLAEAREQLAKVRQRLVWACDSIDGYVIASGLPDNEDAITDWFGNIQSSAREGRKQLHALDAALYAAPIAQSAPGVPADDGLLHNRVHETSGRLIKATPLRLPRRAPTAQSAPSEPAAGPGDLLGLRRAKLQPFAPSADVQAGEPSANWLTPQADAIRAELRDVPAHKRVPAFAPAWAAKREALNEMRDFYEAAAQPRRAERELEEWRNARGPFGPKTPAESRIFDEQRERIDDEFKRHLVDRCDAATARATDLEQELNQQARWAAEVARLRDDAIATAHASMSRATEAEQLGQALADAAHALVGHEKPRMRLPEREALRNAVAAWDTRSTLPGSKETPDAKG